MVINREKNSSVSPTRMALMMLVATIPTAKRTSAKNMLPRMPARMALSALQVHPQREHCCCRAPVISKRARKPILMPKITQRAAAVTVMVPVICRNAAIIPMIRLAIPEYRVQEHLQLHNVMISPPLTIYVADEEML